MLQLSRFVICPTLVKNEFNDCINRIKMVEAELGKHGFHDGQILRHSILPKFYHTPHLFQYKVSSLIPENLTVSFLPLVSLCPSPLLK